ncbi:2OG-Fe(II) oxygenase [Planctomycetota bacterium]
MTKRADASWISNAIEQASRTEKFCVGGTLSTDDVGLVVAGVGEVALPLNPKVAKQLASTGRVAPYGKGTKTLVNTKVRNSFEVNAKLIEFSESWDKSVQETTRAIAEQLGLPAEQLQAKPYKLLLYERGGHFQPHRDSEKVGRMVGSLVIVLPTKFAGGELIVRHGSARHNFDFSAAASEQHASYVAFYADCEHEVKRVTRGRRLAMTYNLSLKNTRKAKPTPTGRSSVDQNREADVLADSLRAWYARRHGDPIVFALEHQYTQKGLRAELLKGADRSLSDLISAASEKTNSRFYLVQIERHLLQYADDGSYGERSWGYRDVDTSDLEIGEAYEDELVASFWVDHRGKRQRFGSLPLNSNAIISAIPFEEWKPTSEEYEGYTGNAGNTLDRWYHRAAIVVWENSQHFDVLARAGTEASITLLHSMLKKLSREK